MTTPLFPAHNIPIFMAQGGLGDCYLLAALDCIFNSRPYGDGLIKAAFTEVSNGVIVKLRHTELSKNLYPNGITDKYDYHYDEQNNQDVFFLSHKRLERIDNTRCGVQTNSLAVKILEHVSVYYYQPNGMTHKRRASVEAHNFLPRYRYVTSTAKFIGSLLNIHASDPFDIDQIIKLKTICPDQPIFLVIDYGVADRFGKQHSRHALRLDKIIPNSTSLGGYDFILVNPWNNQRSEVYHSATLRTRKPEMFFFNTDNPQHGLILLLMQAPEALGHCVFAHPDLLQMVLQIKRVFGRTFSLEDVDYCVKLYQKNVYIPGIFNQLQPVGQQDLAHKMWVAKSNPQGPQHQQVIHFFAMAMESNRRHHLYWAHYYIDMEVRNIQRMPISFAGIDTSQGIDNHCQQMLNQLHTQFVCSPALMAADLLLARPGIARISPLVLRTVAEKTRAILFSAGSHRLMIQGTDPAVAHHGFFSIKPKGIENATDSQNATENRSLST